MGKREPRQPKQQTGASRGRGDVVYRNPADNAWRHAACWKLMEIDPKAAGYELKGTGYLCNSCDAALANEFVWNWHLESADTLRKWAAVLDALVDKTFELAKCALIENRGNAVLQPGDLARLCPDRVEAFQRAWDAAKTTIEQDDTPPAKLYRPPVDASLFKDLAGSFQLWLGHPNPHGDAMDARAVANGQTRLNLVRPVPWLDLSTPADLFELAKRAALGAHSARAARDRAEWHDQKRTALGPTADAARIMGIERHKAAPKRVAESLYRLLSREERHIRDLFTARLERYELSEEELRESRRSDDFLAACVLGPNALRLYEQNKHEPGQNQLARTLLTLAEFEEYQQNPQAWDLCQVFESKLRQYQAAKDGWERMIESHANRMRVGSSRRRKSSRS